LGRSSAAVAVILLVIGKTGSQVFKKNLFNSTDAALYHKNDLVLSQNALFTEDLIFISFLANVAKKFHIVGKKMLYWEKCYIMTLFL
jgi:hypothetical protein